MLFILYFNLVYLILTSALINEEKWIQLNSTSIFVQIFDKKLSFLDAKNYCVNSFDAYLASVKNEDDSIKLIELLIERNITSSWIGLTDISRERRFFRTTRTKSNSDDVFEKDFQRDNNDSSDCILMKQNEEGKYKRVDTPCSTKHSFICMKTNKSDTVKPGILPHHSHYTNQCPESFFPVDGDCFLISSTLLTWEESRLMCKEKNPESDLASIRTDFQQEYFAALISGLSTGFWIGLKNDDNEYKWNLKQPVKIIRWGEHEPKDPQKKNCTFISNNEHNLGNWYTAFCTDKFNAICQTLKKNDVLGSTDSTVVPDLTYDNVLFKKGACEKPGYYYYHDSCYRLHYDKHLKHNDAIVFCNKESFKNKSGYNFLVDLVSLPSAGEKNLILADLRKFSSDLQNKTVWLNIRGNVTEPKVSKQLKNSKLIPLKKIKHLCFKLLRNGVVNSSDCDDNSKGTPMCKYQLKNFNVKSLNSNRLTTTCTKGWTLFNSFCYYLDTKIHQSQYQARTSCFKLKSSLISIDMHQQKFLTDFLKKKLQYLKNSNVWIGLETKNDTNGRLKFNWADESSVTYLNLESVNVTNIREKWCSVFVVKSGLWRLINCTKVNAMVVCQKVADVKALQRNNTIKKPKATPKPGYIIKYNFLTWKEAREKCKSLIRIPGMTSTLATFNNYSEISNIQIMRRNRNTQMFWIGLSGLYDHFDNVFLRWTDGSKLVFQNYQWENLVNLTGSENCVMMDSKTGKWLASNCEVKRPYICEIINSTTKEDDNETKLTELLNNLRRPSHKYCPNGFHEFSNKCYFVVEDHKLQWKSADKYCQELVPLEFSSGASLASIESRFENSYVYSLLSSSLHSTNDMRYWIGERYSSGRNDMDHCAGMSSHPDPYIGARWFSENCSKEFKFICSSLKIPIAEEPLPISQCQPYYTAYNNSLGISCYHFEQNINRLKEARQRCRLQNSNTLLSLPSHYHLHFMLSQYETHGWSRDTPIWLGSEIEQGQKFYHWQWDNGQIVRYTFWNKIPNLKDKNNGTLCMYLMHEKTRNGRFGIQIDECNKLTYKGYIVCEYSINEVPDTKKVAAKKNCLSNSKGSTYEGDMNTTVHGLRCIRWDLLKKPNEIIMSMRKDLGKHNYLQYHANECRYLSDMHHLTTFCAVTSEAVNKSLLLKECIVELCRHKILQHKEDIFNVEHHSNVMTVIIVTLMLIICVIACVALLSWRRWNKTSLFGGYLRRGQFSMLNNQARGTSFNNPIYRPINC